MYAARKPREMRAVHEKYMKQWGVGGVEWCDAIHEIKLTTKSGGNATP